MKTRKTLTREVKILLGSSVMFITGITALFFSSFDLFSITLNPEKWGTISDWVIVLITLLSAIFLLLTLDSQRKVQEDQEKINRYNALDFRNKHKAEIFNDESINFKDLFSCLRYFHFIVKDNNALKLNIKSPVKLEFSHQYSIVENNEDEKYNYYISAIFKDEKFRLEVNKDYALKFLKENNSNEITDKLFIVVEITYEDNFNNVYSKGFEVYFTPFSKRINIISTNVNFIE